MKHHINTSIILISIIFFFSIGSFANVVCIYANGDQLDRVSGHAFITVERDGRTLDTYGYYPEVVPSYSGAAFIRTYNQVLSYERLQELHGDKYIQEKFCHEAKDHINGPLLRKSILDYVDRYLEKHPTYNALQRNCLTFAKQAYMDITGDVIPSHKTTPVGVALYIRRARSKGLTRLADL